MNNEHPNGTRLESERNLAEEFSTSRMTVRRAIEILEGEGLVARYPNRGTFISSIRERVLVDKGREIQDTSQSGSVSASELRLSGSFLKDMQRLGRKPHIQFLEQPFSHAIVDAILAALGKGDIADWFDDTDGVTGASSIAYLGELYSRLLVPEAVTILNLQVVVLAEKPKLKPFFPAMTANIAEQLQISPQRISVQGKTFEGKGIIGTMQGIETRATIALLTRTHEKSPGEQTT